MPRAIKTARSSQPRKGALASGNGSVANVHFSSASDEWETPKELFDQHNVRWRFTLDPCCTIANKKCPRYYTAEVDGLTQPWAPERVWMNPPYGRAIGKWMRKAYEESLLGALVVCLVPARTDTAWWHDYAMKGDVTFIRGRIKYSGHHKDAPFPSALVVLKPQNDRTDAQRKEP